MRKKQFIRWFGLGCLAFCLACSDDSSWVESATQLHLSVSISNDPMTKGLVEQGFFEDGDEIGVFLQGMASTSYEGQSFDNLLFTAVGSGEGQSWSGGPVLLSSAKAKAFCYWPYGSATAENYTEYPISASDQIDYLYSGWTTNISNANPNIVVQMNHALTAIQFNVYRGSYTGVGNLTAVSVSSEGLGASGKLNLADGSLSAVSVGEISLSGLDATLNNSTAYSAKILALPYGATAKPITGVFTIDGRNYALNLSVSEAFMAGTKYIFDIVHDGVQLVVQQVRVTQWSDSGVDQELNPVL